VRWGYFERLLAFCLTEALFSGTLPALLANGRLEILTRARFRNYHQKLG